MKTTVEIPNSVLSEAQKIIQRQRITLKALIEEGLRLAITKHQNQQTFRLKDVSFEGEGLSPEISSASWETIRGIIYEGRGG